MYAYIYVGVTKALEPLAKTKQDYDEMVPRWELLDEIFNLKLGFSKRKGYIYTHISTYIYYAHIFITHTCILRIYYTYIYLLTYIMHIYLLRTDIYTYIYIDICVRMC